MALGLHFRRRGTRGGPPKTMPTTTPILLGCVSLCMAIAAGCYTGRINRRPVVTILPLTGTTTRGQTVKINALANDPDGDRVRYSWFVVPGACEMPPAEGTPPTSQVDPPFSFDIPREGGTAFCVWVTVTD